MFALLYSSRETQNEVKSELFIVFSKFLIVIDD